MQRKSAPNLTEQERIERLERVCQLLSVALLLLVIIITVLTLRYDAIVRIVSQLSEAVGLLGQRIGLIR